jgi:phosphoglycolate phosphatase-like HAD superfamily hydrolase
MKKVILLDIDGVLVRHGGYRAALHATLNHFASLTGLAHFDFPEEKLAELEKRGIFSEWDMVPLLLGTLWNDILSHRADLSLPADLSSAAVEIGRNVNGYLPRELNIPEFEYIAGQYPAEAALQHGCFPFIPMELRINILSQSRNINFSQTMRLFQHYSLGSRMFSETYELPAEVKTESFLHTHDRSNINDTIRDRLIQPNIHLAGLTARPSAPPREVDDSHFGYAPEAEIALKLVGLADIPLIAFGKLEYLAAQRRLDAGALIKPSPVHALAATAAAFTGNEWTGLQSAGDWFQTGQLKGVFDDLPRTFELFVVEDTLGGIRSTQAAGKILQQSGFDVTVHALGLTSGSASKIEAFSQAGVCYFETWESLLAQYDL